MSDETSSPATEGAEAKKPDVIEIAKRARHFSLYKKIKEGKTLTKAELTELKEYEIGDLPPGIIKTQEQIAKIFGVNIRTIGNWVRDGMPRTADGFYDVEAIYSWRLERKGGGDSDSSGKEHWETEFRQYQALKAKIQYQKLLGELITKEEVEQGRIQRVMTIKKALLGLPARLAPQVVNLEVKKAEEIIRIRIEEIISDFARGGDGTVNTKSDSADVVVGA